MIAFTTIWAGLLIAIFISRYKTPNNEKAIIVYAKIDPNDSKKFLIQTKGRIFIWPIIQKYYTLYIGEYGFNKEFKFKDITKKLIDTTVTVNSCPDINNLELLVSKYFNKTSEEIKESILSKIILVAEKELGQQKISKEMTKSLFKSLKPQINLILIENGFQELKSLNIFFKLP